MTLPLFADLELSTQTADQAADSRIIAQHHVVASDADLARHEGHRCDPFDVEHVADEVRGREPEPCGLRTHRKLEQHLVRLLDVKVWDLEYQKEDAGHADRILADYVTLTVKHVNLQGSDCWFRTCE